MGEWVVVVWLAAAALMFGAVVWKKMNERGMADAMACKIYGPRPHPDDVHMIP